MEEQEHINRLLSDPHVSEVLGKADEAISQGGSVYFKWTCRGCGERATSEDRNGLHPAYLHEDCGYTTDTVDGDLGFVLVLGLS